MEATKSINMAPTSGKVLCAMLQDGRKQANIGGTESARASKEEQEGRGTRTHPHVKNPL